MLKIIELKKTVENSSLINNLYEIQKITRNIINKTENIIDINADDYNYINIIFEKTKDNLQKCNNILKI